MRVAVLGAGPAGLLFSLLARRRFPHWRVDVFEQNPPGATFGFGVVFSEGALAFLERDAPDLHAALLPRMERWPMQRIVHRGEAVDIDGNGFSAVARLTLNQFLHELCLGAGVQFHFGKPVRSLSGGQQQMVAVGRALMSQPRLLMLDEPSLGIAPRLVSAIFTALAEINRGGVAVLLVEQNVPTTLTLAHRAYLLEGGRIAGHGLAADLLHDPHVRRAYLGPLAVRG